MTEPEFRGVTIDAAHSKDLDDSVWVERSDAGWIVTVAVALVAEAVAKGSDLDRIAHAAAFTRYKNDSQSRPMLPRDLSEEALTLTPGSTKRVLAYIIHLDEKFEVAQFEMATGTLTHEGRLSHAEAGDLIMGGGQRELHMMMHDAWLVASGLLALRRRNGALAFFSANAGVMTDEEGRIVSMRNGKPTSRAHLVVQELMILANRTAAEHFASKGIGLLYRNHRGNPVADKPTLQEDLRIAAEGGLHSDAAAKRLSMMIGRATLSGKVSGHFGLNIPVYAWMTSPIRRYADLVNQRIALATIRGEDSPYTTDELDAVGEHLNEVVSSETELRNAHYRQRSDAAADRNIEISRVASLGSKEFSAVIKHARDARSYSPTVVAEIARRLKERLLSSKDMGRLLLTKGDLSYQVHKHLMRHLVEFPHDALMTLNYLIQDGYAEQMEMTEDGDGIHFQAAMTLVLDGKHFSSIATGSNKRMAHQRATVDLFGKFSLPDWTEPNEWPTADKSSAKALASGNLNAKGDLIAFCQAKKFGIPLFEMNREGPAHAPSFTATVFVTTPQGKVSTGPVSALSKKEAEREVSEVMLRRLQQKSEAARQPNGKVPGVFVPKSNPKENPRGYLQELCQARGWPLPVYEVEQGGEAMAPIFTAMARLQIGDDVYTSSPHKSSSKKPSQTLAARDLLAQVRELD
jgi:ribonuclease R